MTTELEIGLYIFMLAGFLGYHLISRVPPLLHVPLMSATNGMSGISLVRSLLVAGADYTPLSTLFGFIAVTCSSTNVVGGFLITDRMLKMFKKAPAVAEEGARAEARLPFKPGSLTLPVLAAGLFALLYWFEQIRAAVSSIVDPTKALSFFYIFSAALFILGLKGLSSPKYARKGMFLAEFGMLMAVVGTLFHRDIVEYQGIKAGLLMASVIWASMALWIPITPVPHRTALSHSLGALAATLIGISEYVRHAGALDRVLM